MTNTHSPNEVAESLRAELQKLRENPKSVDSDLLQRIGENRNTLQDLVSDLAAAKDWQTLSVAASSLSEIDRIVSEAYEAAKRDAKELQEILELSKDAGEEDRQGIVSAIDRVAMGNSEEADPLLILKILAPEKHCEFAEVSRKALYTWKRLGDIPHYKVRATNNSWDANEAARDADERWSAA